MDAPPERTALYRLYGADDRLLYVGVSNDPPNRMQQHAGDKPWWPEVARHGLEWLDTRDEALDAERLAIYTEKPKYNHTHNPSEILDQLRPTDLYELSSSPWRPFEFIAADLRAFVHSGSLLPGEKFPTTAELIAAFGVSSLTVQRALKLLKAEGFAVGRMGSAVRAALPPGFRREQATIGDVEGVIELLPADEGRQSIKVCKALGVERGTPTRTRRWIRHIDGAPVELVDHFDHPDAAPTDEVRRAIDLVSAHVPVTDEVVKLRLPKDAPTLSIVRSLLTEDRRVVAVQRIVKSGHLLTVGYTY